jgi:hypothetical protein
MTRSFAAQDYSNIVGTLFGEVTVAYQTVGQVGCRATADPTSPVGADGQSFSPQIVSLQNVIEF